MEDVNDLVYASQFVEPEKQQEKTIIATEEATLEEDRSDSNTEIAQSVELIKEDPVECVKAETVECVKEEPIKDRLDAAIAGELKEEDYESSDLELSSDDEDSSDEDNGQQTMQMEEDDDTKDEILKTANEITDFVVEKPVFNLTQQTEVVYAGKVLQIVDNVIVIESRPGSEYSALDAGSLLVYENREILGEVFETFGPIIRPYYTVRFNDASEINSELTSVETPVYYVPTYHKTQIIQTERLKKIKYTDASNFFDEEVGEDEVEFSDDEKELAYRQEKNREKKMKKRARQAEAESNKRMRTAQTDFDAALDAYQGSSVPPPRQQQSYADL